MFIPRAVCSYRMLYPIGSMYGIYANIWGILMVNVTNTIHGSYGYIKHVPGLFQLTKWKPRQASMQKSQTETGDGTSFGSQETNKKSRIYLLKQGPGSTACDPTHFLEKDVTLRKIETRNSCG